MSAISDPGISLDLYEGCSWAFWLFYFSTFRGNEEVEWIGAARQRDLVTGPFAIWNSLNVKQDFRRWSLCIVLEASGPVVKWMFLGLNEGYWLAVDNPSEEGCT